MERRGGGGEHRGYRYSFAHDAQTRAERNLKAIRRKRDHEKNGQKKKQKTKQLRTWYQYAGKGKRNSYLAPIRGKGKTRQQRGEKGKRNRNSYLVPGTST